MHTLEGKIHIKLAWDGQRISRAALQPRTLVRIGALLHGKSAQQAAHMIPMLFSLCGKAQAAAATRALEAAADLPASSAPLLRERLVLCEALQETLWRLVLDLPRLFGLETKPALLAQVRQRCAQACAAPQDESGWQQFVEQTGDLIDQALFGSTAARWHEITEFDALIDYLRPAQTITTHMLLTCWNGAGRRGGSTIALMPATERAAVLAALIPGLNQDPEFARQPHWQGQLMETGALARMSGHVLLAPLLQQEGASILARLLARLLELRMLSARLQAPSPPADAWVQGANLGDGHGLAWVQSARGLLLHQARLDRQGRIADYRIVAPTEWNFHPAGPCIAGLTGQPAASAQQAHYNAELLIQTLDPCVAYQIDIEEDHA